MNYKVTRIGLLNFWYFDDEEFNFSDGKILLRGENGSGKSVTMQSFIPLILDGNKMPSRLDPFGSKEKRIEDYLLGPSDGVQKDDSTGYLYMETYNEKLDKYITIGMGLRARKGQSTEFWGFALKDGKRIGIDFSLYKDSTSKTLLTKRELRSRLENTNEYTETQKDYKAMVNKLLFGFKDLDSYDEFINVLLQLRSSKLSKEYTPVKLMGILSSVLQPLTEEDIIPLSEAIEDTNKTKEKIEKLQNQLKSLSNLLKTYQNYNEIMLYLKARKYSEKNKLIKDKQLTLKNNEQELEESKKRQIDIKSKLEILDKELIEIETKLETIDNKDLKKYTSDLEVITNDIDKLNNIIETLKNELDEKITEEKKTEVEIKKCQDKIDTEDTNLIKTCDDVITLSDEIKLNDVHAVVSKIQSGEDNNFDYLRERVNKYKIKLTQIKNKLEEKEKLEKNINDLEEEHEKIIKEQENISKTLNSKKEKLQEELDNFIDNITKIDKDNKFVKLDINTKTKIFEYIRDYNYDNYIKAKEEYISIAKYFENDARTSQNNTLNKLNIEKETLKKLNDELEVLKSNKELEIEEDNSVISKLNELNIPYISLYKAIEFKDNIKEEDKNKIEELLISMNILNAKIVSNKDLNRIDNINAVFLKKGIKKDKNLTNYFNVIENEFIEKKEVIEILESISINENDNSYINPNKFELDFIVGYPSGEYNSKYIGLIKRIEEQKRKIEEKQEEINEQEAIIRNIENILTEMDRKIENILIESNLFPSNRILEEIKKEIEKFENYIEVKINQDNEITNKILEISKKIELVIIDINNLRENITIPLILANFKEALELIDNLKEYINKLESIYTNLNMNKDQKIFYENRLSDIRLDIERKTDEMSDKSKNLTSLESKKKTIEEILSNSDYQKLIEELQKLTERKNSIPNERDILINENGKIENIILNLSNSIEIDKKELNNNLLELELLNMILEKEYNLNYIYKDEKLDVNKILEDLNLRKNSDKVQATANYSDAYNNYRLELMDYRLSNKQIFDNNDELIEMYAKKGLDTESIKNIINESIRLDMSVVYQGKIINLYELENNLEESIKESENYITTQERRLFEDILLKTVGRKIRDRIDSSKEWVSKMNKIMLENSEDSNLSFQLEWKSKVAYTEDELDTKEIVRILRIDSGQIDKKDSDKLIMHFTNQIKKELEFSEKTHESYTSIIGRVLDYRNWFEFKLYYKRKSGEKKELTNKIFFILSGGERAKSMYIPLFAAVYAKLLNAEEHHLRLIALDEAFAGVDNENIREMFAILSKLNLDYILTSQALWGDYDTINSLSICKLIKDEEHKAVAVKHYLWNGKIMKLSEV